MLNLIRHTDINYNLFFTLHPRWINLLLDTPIKNRLTQKISQNRVLIRKLKSRNFETDFVYFLFTISLSLISKINIIDIGRYTLLTIIFMKNTCSADAMF